VTSEARNPPNQGARVDDQTIDNPATYQDFFTVLDKAIFLTRHNVD